MRCRKVRRFLRYLVPNKLLSPEKVADNVLRFYIRSEMKKNCYQVFHHYQNKLREQVVQHIININKIKFEPYCDLFDQDNSKFNETLINNQ